MAPTVFEYTGIVLVDFQELHACYKMLKMENL